MSADNSFAGVVRCDRDTISLDCPLDCLKTVLSAMAFNPLARAYDAPFDPPDTVGAVVKLYEHGQLGKIKGLGPRRIGEIEVCLIYTDLTHVRSHRM